MIPIFGVCLGLQSLAIGFGARLKRLNVVKHGQVSLINHTGIEIFDGVGSVNAVRYHSLHVELQEGGEMQLLAWADDGVENGRVVMAVKHRTKPFWAVQYHPESVCTEGGGLEVVSNFWRLAQDWARRKGRKIVSWMETQNRVLGRPWPPVFEPRSTPHLRPTASTVSTTILDLPNLPVTAICELFDVSQEPSPFVLLDSAAQPGRFSIVACLTPISPRITYFVGEDFVTVTRGDSYITKDLGSQDVWSWLASFMRGRVCRGGCPDIPFWGGLVGYLTYELGMTSLPVCHKLATADRQHADVNVIFVERSIVVDSATGKIYLQSIVPGDEAWMANIRVLLENADYEASKCTNSRVPHLNGQHQASSASPVVTLPSKTLYTSRINQAKEHLFSGDSYELCLTAHTHVSIAKPPILSPNVSTSWERYKTLRKNNPAPHSGYIRLGPTTLLASSPERFLSFSRPPRTICQLRPIKGTVRKGPGIDRVAAEKALIGSTKEVAENLMIVDLIRHDLHGVIGENVQVKQFCRVEEYETVWQLVSVIEGGLSVDADAELGWDVLKRSLPPGLWTSVFLCRLALTGSCMG
jgi:para-aminobenzoate synthetase